MKIEIESEELAMWLFAVALICLSLVARGCSNQLTDQERAFTAATNTLEILKSK